MITCIALFLWIIPLNSGVFYRTKCSLIVYTVYQTIKSLRKLFSNAKGVFATLFPLGYPLRYFSRTKPHLEPKNENHVTRGQAQRAEPGSPSLARSDNRLARKQQTLRIPLLLILFPTSDHHQFSPNNISTYSTEKVTRIK